MFACVSLEARKRPHSWISLIFWGRSIMRTGIRLGLGTEKPLPLELAGVGVKSAVGSLLGLYCWPMWNLRRHSLFTAAVGTSNEFG